MNHALPSDFESIKNIFYSYRAIFPHIRTDYLRRQIASNNCVFHNGIVITYNIYKRKQRIGDCQAFKGDCILHQIVKEEGSDATNALQDFFQYVNAPVWLSVRRDNLRAKKYYEKNNMEKVGEIYWAKGKLPGDVYKYVPVFSNLTSMYYE
tara:strand:+ start:585 stop:1037 length:453 start_codon:yes stop_codon:yes gene_type:complete